MSDLATKLNFKISEASPEYKKRRQQQMIFFMGSSVVTLVATRLAFRMSVTRQFLPTLFQGNHQPPTSYNFVADAAVAVGTGTLLCASASLMSIFGTCWMLDVSNFKEFGWRMKLMMGGYLKEKELLEIPMDDETATIQNTLNDILDGKYEELEWVDELELTE